TGPRSLARRALRLIDRIADDVGAALADAFAVERQRGLIAAAALGCPRARERVALRVARRWAAAAFVPGCRARRANLRARAFTAHAVHAVARCAGRTLFAR